MPDYYDKPLASNHNELHSGKTAGTTACDFTKNNAEV